MTNPIPPAESLTVEFKSDARRITEKELVEAVVCTANGEGGAIYLGVENDGTPTGLHAAHMDRIDTLPALIANTTEPRLSVTAQQLSVDGVQIAVIEVPQARTIVGTKTGTYRRRRMGLHGPECVAFLPHEMNARLSNIGALDPTSVALPEAKSADLDPAERARVRQFVERYGGDQALVDLSDDELDGALGFVSPDGIPTLTGVLMIGRDAAIRRLVPTHEAAFQVLHGETVHFNEYQRWPLLRLFEWMETQFMARNDEQELQAGLFRVGVPRVDRQAFRESLANAFVHRDYSRLGAVVVKLDERELNLSNPGGFVEGLTPHNILKSPPRPRNPALADAFKRVGLVERTGRGVDRIFRLVVRFGRPRPSYADSDATMVVLQIPAAQADLALLRRVIEAENQGAELPTLSLLALSVLREQRRMQVDDLAEALNVDRNEAKATVESLVEAGLVEAHGQTRGRRYLLAKELYEKAGDAARYARQVGLSPAEQESRVLDLARKQREIRRADVMRVCGISGDAATHLLRRLTEAHRLIREGETRYRLPTHGES